MTMLAWTMDYLAEEPRLPRERVLFPLSFSYLDSHVSRVSHPEDTWPGSRVQGTNCLFAHGKKKAQPLPWRGGLDWTAGAGKKTRRANALTLTRTPFTSATMHRDTKVTTSINTSHYEYCFQREAIHGIKTSTGSSSTRAMKLQVVRSGHDCA